MVLKCLVKHGIGAMSSKNTVEIDRSQWYPQERWLAAWEEIANNVGPRACFQIGRQVPKNAAFPPSITEIHGAVASIDVAYHMNHRKNGASSRCARTRIHAISTEGWSPRWRPGSR